MMYWQCSNPRSAFQRYTHAQKKRLGGCVQVCWRGVCKCAGGVCACMGGWTSGEKGRASAKRQVFRVEVLGTREGLGMTNRASRESRGRLLRASFAAQCPALPCPHSPTPAALITPACAFQVFTAAQAVSDAEAHLQGLLPQLAAAAGVSRLSYVSIMNQGSWLIELPATRADVPAGWEKVSLSLRESAGETGARAASRGERAASGAAAGRVYHQRTTAAGGV